MKNYSLIPLEVARNPVGADEGFAVVSLEVKPLKTLPVFIFYIEGPKEKILIDCGKAPEIPQYHQELFVRMYPDGLPKIHGSWGAVEKALSRVGLKPADIDAIIVTHAHPGHLGYINEFPKAKFYIQREELEFALNPIGPYRQTYLRDKLFELERNPRLKLVDGDVEIVPGVSVIKAPGHTPGLQAVAVETASGVVVYASDHVYTYHAMYPNHGELGGVPLSYTNYVPPSNYLSLPQCHASFDKLSAAADILLPAHDDKLKDGVRIPPAPYRPLPQ